MQVKSIAECSKGGDIPLEHSAILSSFIKLPFVIKIFVLSIFEWPFYTGLLYLSYHIPNNADLDEMSHDALYGSLICLLKYLSKLV